jgi:hypothetical protein
MVGNFCFRPPGERRAVGAGHAGISGRNLLSLLLKFVSVEGCETVLYLASRIKLPHLVHLKKTVHTVHKNLHRTPWPRCSYDG